MPRGYWLWRTVRDVADYNQAVVEVAAVMGARCSLHDLHAGDWGHYH